MQSPTLYAGRRCRTSDGFEQHMGVNHLAHFSLTLRLLPLLKASSKTSPLGSRIVNVSSALHELAHFRSRDMHLVANYNAELAYANSKC
jgi:NAD(P)-dependent dehydrogenase (short-subunit alcohol dehydrogenase family)